MSHKQYDVIILGAGFSGAILSMILAKQGRSVCIVEANEHPRFAIGESTVPQTSAMLRLLGLKHGIPALLKLSSFTEARKVLRQNGVKRNFGFVYHSEGKVTGADTVLQSVIPDLPHGPENHFFRQELDQYLFHEALRAGVEVLQRTKIAVLTTESSKAEVRTEDGSVLEAELVIDCAGFRSPIAAAEGLRDPEPRMRTNSRTIFNHFLDVKPFDDVLPLEGVIARRWHQGTCHHLFPGGWFWVIPFNNTKGACNPLTSIGVCLDTKKYPENPSLSAEEEFFGIVNRFPSIKQQFEGCIPARSWVRAPRMQYSSSRCTGDRYALLGHSASFLDPLFSRGFPITLEGIDLLADLIRASFEKSDFSQSAFSDYERFQQSSMETTDHLISLAYSSLDSFATWSIVFRAWLLGVTMGALRINRHLGKFKETGDLKYLDLDYARLRYPGFICPDLDSYHDLLIGVEKILRSKMSEDTKLERALHVFAEADFAPDILRLAQKDLVVPLKYTLFDFMRIMRWGKNESPEYIRSHYFDFGPKGFLTAAFRNRNIQRELVP